MTNILFIPKTREELEMIKEFAIQNNLTFNILLEEKSEGEIKPYVTADEGAPVVNEAAGVYLTEKKSNKKEAMEQVIVDISNENDLQYIEQVLSERGIAFRKEKDIDFQQRMRARQKFVEASKNWPSYDISMDEIVAMVKEVRAERYARSQNKDSH